MEFYRSLQKNQQASRNKNQEIFNKNNLRKKYLNGDNLHS